MTASIIAKAIEAGSVAAAFAPCKPVDDTAIGLYSSWLVEGRNAGMDYLAGHIDIRRDPRLLLDGARSMLCCAFSYNQEPQHRSPLFSDYAVGDDYHEVLRRRLEPVAVFMQQLLPGSQTRICVDTAPLRERYWAKQAGLGFIGLNNQLIIPGFGSKVFLAEILWTGEAEYGLPIEGDCGRCGACIKACPERAIDSKGTIDCARCLSYLTIEHKGELPGRLSLPQRIYGCDICQDVCPHNTGVVSPCLAEFKPRQSVLALNLQAIADMTQSEFSAVFAHSAVKRCKLAGLVRNAKRSCRSLKPLKPCAEN